MLGRKSAYAAECFAGNFIGADYGIREDLTGKLPDNWRDFNEAYIPVFLESHPNMSRIAAGLSCGALWSFAKGIRVGDFVLCPDGSGAYRVAEVTGDYHYVPEGILPHRRPVRWLSRVINRDELSESLKASVSSPGTVTYITKHAAEITGLLAGAGVPVLISTDETVVDPAAFAMEKHLEDFLVLNWSQTELGRAYDIFQYDGELVGQQYQSDTGPIDILAISKDRKTLLVIELKKGRASDVVVGQILRYMGYVKDVLAEEDQVVRGVIIALRDDPKIRRALAMVQFVDFYRYEVTFRLVKG